VSFKIQGIKKPILVKALLTILCLLLMGKTVLAADQNKQKVIVIMAENLQIDDLKKPELSNLRKLYSSGGLGLMNARNEAIISGSRASAYKDLVRSNQLVFVNLGNTTAHSLNSYVGSLFSGDITPDCAIVLISLTPDSGGITGRNVLNPIIVYKNGGQSGILSSNTTNRDGLVSNIDIAPTIFDLLGKNSKTWGFLGEKITVKPEKDNLLKISGQLEDYKTLKKARYFIHGLYIISLGLALAALYIPVFYGKEIINGRIGRIFAVMTFALPGLSFLVYRLFQAFFNIYIVMILIIIAAGIYSFLFSKNREASLTGIALIGIATTLYIVLDLLAGLNTLQKTPLGFNDVFIGGRYYGINNDCMGFLLGAYIYSLFYFYQRLCMKKSIKVLITASFGVVTVVSMTPPFGANVGGTIAAMITGLIALIVLITERPIKKNTLLGLILLVFIIELIIAYLDFKIGGLSTHAGKAMGAILSQGPAKLLEILKSKLSLFAFMLILPPWNLFLGLQFYIYFKTTKRINLPYFEIILYGGLAAFVFNDTGVISTAIMLTFLTIPLGLLLNTKKL
jgi:hypothetical protein